MSDKTSQDTTTKPTTRASATARHEDSTVYQEPEDSIIRTDGKEPIFTPDGSRGENAICFRPEWQEECCNDAKRNGFIGLGHLVYILATDEHYTEESILNLWKKYQISIRRSAEPDVSTPGARAGVWQALLERWAFGTVAGVGGKTLDAISYLPLYTWDPETGELKDYDRKGKMGAAYVKLDDLKEYFANRISPALSMPRLLSDVQLEPLIESDRPELAEHENVFVRHGHVWYVKYKGKSTVISDLKGMAYLAFLLENKGKDFNPLELSFPVNPPPPAEQDISGSLAGEGVQGFNTMEDFYEDLDIAETKEQKEDFIHRVEQFYKKSKSGDAEDIENWNKTKGYIMNFYGYKVYERGDRLYFIKMKEQLRKDIDRVRKRLTKAIRDAGKAILRQLPEAESFLGDIHTGNKFYYRPKIEIRWFIKI